MAIIKKYNKQNGTTYVYDSVSYWDKEKQQPRSKRKLIGKIDPVSGEIVPTEGRGRKPKPAPAEPSTPARVAPGGGTESGHAGLSGQDDYMRLYEESRREILERDASISSLKATIVRLTSERQELVAKLEQLARDYGGLKERNAT